MPPELETNWKDYITPTYYSWFSYCLVALYFLAGVVFLPFTVMLRHREEDKFQCDFLADALSKTDKDTVTPKCYTKYDERYNSPAPLYGMLLSSLASVLVVCFIYSCYMRSKSRSRIAPIINEENVTPLWMTCTTTTPCTQKLGRVFCLYLLQLVTRLVLMISITAASFYPSGFPQEFDCDSPGKPQRNSTHFNATDTLSCHTSGSVSRDKAVLSKCFWGMNIVFIIFMLVEIAYLAGRASRGSEFTVDRQFMAEYFGNRTSTLSYREHLRQTTLRKTEKLDRFSDNEEERTIDDMFVVLPLELESEPRRIFDDYQELFLPRTTRDSVKVLIRGLAGSGKSLLCQKLMRDWSKKSHDDDSPGFDFAFLFKFRCYSKTTEKISLRQLLNPATKSESELEQVIQQLLDNPEKILLIFDGLDEFGDHETCTRNDGAFENKAEQEMPVLVLYKKLLEGKLLRGATVLTTSRPPVTSRIEISLFDKIVDINEFTEEKVEKYVSNYCKPDQVAAMIKQHIKNNSDLLSLCAIPLYCHTICYLLMKEVGREGNPESAGCLPTRNTEIYKKVLEVSVSKYHSEDRDRSLIGTDSFSDVDEQALEKLGILARGGIRKSRTTFRPVDVRDITTNFGLLKQTKDDNGNFCFCFVHPVFQNFLAARTIVNSNNLERNIDGVIGGLRKGNMKWYSVIQFVAGLLNNGPGNKAVKSLISCLQKSLSSNDPQHHKMALLMMKCLYEYNDDNLTKTAMSELQTNSELSKRINLKNCGVGPVDCTAIVYVLKLLPCGLQYSVDLSDNSIDEFGCKELAKLVKSGGPTGLDLSNNKISDEALVELTKATRSEQSNIRDLHITFDKRPTN